MAVQHRRFTASNPAAGTSTLLYTVPAGRKAIVRTVSQSTDAVSTTGTSMVLLLGSSALLSEVFVQPSSSRLWPLSTVLLEGEELRVTHLQGVSQTMVELVELDAIVEGLTLHRIDLRDIATAERSAFIPADRRFRVRELVLSTAGATTDVQVRISAGGTVGYLAKVSTREPAVIGLDMLLFGGETITARGTGTGNVNAYLSGVLEAV